MARRRSRRSRLGALGEPITGSLLLWVGIPALLLWLAGKKKKPDGSGSPALPDAGLVSVKQAKTDGGFVPKALPAAKSSGEVAKGKIAKGLEKAKLERVRDAAVEAVFGPMWAANLLPDYASRVCAIKPASAASASACADASAYLTHADEAAEHEERGLGAPLVAVKWSDLMPRMRLKLVDSFLELSLPAEYEGPYYAIISSYLDFANFAEATVVKTAMCSDDAGSAACQLATRYQSRAS
jgi:hypothetical protein